MWWTSCCLQTWTNFISLLLVASVKMAKTWCIYLVEITLERSNSKWSAFELSCDLYFMCEQRVYLFYPNISMTLRVGCCSFRQSFPLWILIVLRIHLIFILMIVWKLFRLFIFGSNSSPFCQLFVCRTRALHCCTGTKAKALSARVASMYLVKVACSIVIQSQSLWRNLETVLFSNIFYFAGSDVWIIVVL
jgi:hypothetical protein